VEQLRLFPWTGEATKRLSEAGYKVIIVSNQPGIAKGHLSRETFEKIRQKMKRELAKNGASAYGSTANAESPSPDSCFRQGESWT